MTSLSARINIQNTTIKTESNLYITKPGFNKLVIAQVYLAIAMNVLLNFNLQFTHFFFKVFEKIQEISLFWFPA